MAFTSMDALHEQFHLLLDEDIERLVKLRSLNADKQHFTTTESSFRLRQYLEHQNISFQLLSYRHDISEDQGPQQRNYTELAKEGLSGAILTGIVFTHADIEFVVYSLRWRRDRELLYMHDLAFGSAGDPDSPGRLLVQEVMRWHATVYWCISVFQRGTWVRDVHMWDAVQESRWGSLVLSEDLVETLQRDTELFFNSKDLYDALGTVWKRGIILYGI